MWKIDIDNEVHFITCKEGFVQLVEQHMGRDAADWLKAFIQEGADVLEGAVFLTLVNDYFSRIEEANNEIKAKVKRAAKNDLPPMWA